MTPSRSPSIPSFLARYTRTYKKKFVNEQSRIMQRKRNRRAFNQTLIIKFILILKVLSRETDPVYIRFQVHSIGTGILFTTYICWQRRYWKLLIMASELVKPWMLFFLGGQRRNERSAILGTADDACSAVETSANIPRSSYPYGAMNFHGRVGN